MGFHSAGLDRGGTRARARVYIGRDNKKGKPPNDSLPIHSDEVIVSESSFNERRVTELLSFSHSPEDASEHSIYKNECWFGFDRD